MAEPPIRRNSTETKGGTNVAAMKWVLGLSIVLAVAALVWTFVLAPTATQPVMSASTAN